MIASYKHLANVRLPRINLYRHTDLLALHAARRFKENALQCSNISGSWADLIYFNRSDFTAVASTNAEASLLAQAANPTQPFIAAAYFDPATTRRVIRIKGQGVFSTTGTPTLIFRIRLGTTQGDTYLSGTVVAVTAAITTASGAANTRFSLEHTFVCTLPGYGTTNCTLAGAGSVESMTGFATPFKYDMEPTTPATATWTATLDGALTQWINLTATWSASSASNTITLKQLTVEGLN